MDPEMTQIIELVNKLIKAVIIIHWLYLAPKSFTPLCRTL